MARALSSLCILTLAVNLGFFANLVRANDFAHHEVLDKKEKFHLFWEFDDEKIEFEAQVQTTGWVGLGLSPNGGMSGSDIVIGWVKDGTAHLTDRYAEAMAQPPVDESQDWELVSGYENGTHTVLRFNRKLTTCDEKDRVINEDTMRVIWAWHDQDPEDESGVKGPAYHEGNRGTRSMMLLRHVVPDPPSTETTYTFDIVMRNVSIPVQQNTYWCRVFELPKLTRKHHVIKFEPVITPGNEGVVHHLSIMNCEKNRNLTIVPKEHPGFECVDEDAMPRDWLRCEFGSIVAAWGIGGGSTIYPENTGYPIGDHDDSGYVLLEMHYHNHQVASGLYDSSGIRLTYTPELRDNDLGILAVGNFINQYIVIPPHDEGFKSAGFCSTDCLDAFLQERGQPIHIVGVGFHTHLLGIKMSTRLIHNGVETEIVRDDNYDFNLQLTRMLTEEVTVSPGDTLITECTYGTTHKNSVSFGGLATTEEMCYSFFLYYPKFNLSWCDSIPDIGRTVGYAGVQNFTVDEGNLLYNEFSITAPPRMVNMSFKEAMEAVPWTAEKARDFNQYILNGTYFAECRTSHQSRINTYPLWRHDLPFPRGTRRPTEDICSRSPAADTVGDTAASQPHYAEIYVFAIYLVALVLVVVLISKATQKCTSKSMNKMIELY